MIVPIRKPFLKNLNNWVTVCDAFYGSEGCTLMKMLSLTIYQCLLNFLECMAAVMLYRLPSPRFVVIIVVTFEQNKTFPCAGCCWDDIK